MPDVTLAEFEAIAPMRRGCWFGRLDPDRQAKVSAAHAAGYSQTTIRQVLGSWGEPAGKTAVSSHFAGRCSCA